MHDLVGAYQRLERIYHLYIKSAFPLRYRALADERDTLLQQPGILSQPPLVEPVPIYPSWRMNLSAAANELHLARNLKKQRIFLNALVRCKFL